MAVRFKPMPGLTIAVLICLPILIGLGVWQYQRWQWKTDILAEIEASVTAPPVAGLAELDDLIADSAPVDFRRIQISGRASGPTWYLYRPEGSIQWTPFRLVEQDMSTALVGFPSIEDRIKETAPDVEMDGPRAGYIRRIRPTGGLSAILAPTNNPEANRWFTVNPDGEWVEGASVWIDISENETDADSLPIRRPDIPNNHVSYMLTWWSFAIILIIIYALLHKRAGRLSFS